MLLSGPPLRNLLALLRSRVISPAQIDWWGIAVPSHLTHPSGRSVKLLLPAVGFITQAIMVPRGELLRSVTADSKSWTASFNFEIFSVMTSLSHLTSSFRAAFSSRTSSMVRKSKVEFLEVVMSQRIPVSVW